MRQAIRIVICSLILVLLLAPAYDAFASAAKKRVLVLYSFDKGTRRSASHHSARINKSAKDHNIPGWSERQAYFSGSDHN